MNVHFTVLSCQCSGSHTQRLETSHQEKNKGKGDWQVRVDSRDHKRRDLDENETKRKVKWMTATTRTR